MRCGLRGRKESEGIRWHKGSRGEGRDGYSHHPGIYPNRQSSFSVVGPHVNEWIIYEDRLLKIER